jgi:hypothetical protein
MLTLLEPEQHGLADIELGTHPTSTKPTTTLNTSPNRLLVSLHSGLSWV